MEVHDIYTRARISQININVVTLKLSYTHVVIIGIRGILIKLFLLSIKSFRGWFRLDVIKGTITLLRRRSGTIIGNISNIHYEFIFMGHQLENYSPTPFI